MDFLFDTNRFNLSEVKPHFINPSCFGDDLAAWLKAKLTERGIPTIEPGQEDWGWYVEARIGDANYFIGVGGSADESARDPNKDEWRLIVEKQRGLAGQDHQEEQGSAGRADVRRRRGDPARGA